MTFSEVMDRFVEQSAVTAMLRGTLEYSVTPELPDEVCAQTAKRPRCGELLFSSVVDLLGRVAVDIRKSVSEAYLAKREQFAVSVPSGYNKPNGVETEVSRQMVRQTSWRIAAVTDRLGRRRRPVLRGVAPRLW